MEATTSNEDVLVVLQTESGEQIALPMSALPSDFVPGDSGQIIMVESALDDQQQEVVVESSDYSETRTTTEELVFNHTDSGSNLDANSTIDESSITATPAFAHNDIPMIQIQEGEKQVPRTYSKNNVVKSYAPTCGTTRIYQQSQAKAPQPNHQISLDRHRLSPDESVTTKEGDVTSNPKENTATVDETTISSDPQADNQTPHSSASSTITDTNLEIVIVPRKKQKRKETLLTKPLNEEDIELEFQIMEEPSPKAQELEIKRKPRKEYRTKKKRLAMEMLSREECDTGGHDSEQGGCELRAVKEEVMRTNELDKEESTAKEAGRESEARPKREESKSVRESKREFPRREVPKRGTKDKPVQSTKPQMPPQCQPERRTRLSNTCRVATGKSYKCNDCDFSTDRINNIILHVKESCPKLKRT